VSRETSPVDPFDWFGLANPNGTITESGVDYGDAISAMEGAPVRQATLQLCRNAPVVALSAAAPRARLRHRRARPSRFIGCVGIRVHYAGAPVNGARLEVTFRRTSGRSPVTPLARTAVAGGAGTATECVSSRQAAAGVFTVQASRADFALTGSRTIRVRLRPR
jgi:hypothetical protein